MEIDNKVRESDTFSVACCLDGRLSQSHRPGQGVDLEDGLGDGISSLSRSGRGWGTGRGNGKERPKPWQQELLVGEETSW